MRKVALTEGHKVTRYERCFTRKLNRFPCIPPTPYSERKVFIDSSDQSYFWISTETLVMPDPKMKLIQSLIWYAATAAVSYWVLLAGLRQLDTNREENKRAIEQRKQLFKRLGRRPIQTTPYEASYFPLLLYFLCSSIHSCFFMFNRTQIVKSVG